MKEFRMATALAAALLCAAPAAAQDIDAGAAQYKSTCRNCHGPTAKGLASYPKLAGQPLDYLVSRLKQYRAGDRLGPNTPLMAPQARDLSDEDILNIASYIVETY
ncbi:MAG: c-type cytochrome [Pseudomonadota bacterium]